MLHGSSTRCGVAGCIAHIVSLLCCLVCASRASCRSALLGLSFPGFCQSSFVRLPRSRRTHVRQNESGFDSAGAGAHPHTHRHTFMHTNRPTRRRQFSSPSPAPPHRQHQRGSRAFLCSVSNTEERCVAAGSPPSLTPLPPSFSAAPSKHQQSTEGGTGTTCKHRGTWAHQHNRCCHTPAAGRGTAHAGHVCRHGSEQRRDEQKRFRGGTPSFSGARR